jgi:prepilin-type N-terminal cleavage/methylation domain-containing protein
VKILNRSNSNIKGMTLVEMIMATAILTLVSAVITLVLIRTYSVNKYTIEQGLNNSNLQLSVGNFTKNVREARQSDAGAYLIFSGEDFNLKFFSDVDNDSTTERLHYFLEDEYFKLGISKPFGFPPQYPDGDEEVKIVGSNILNQNDEPIFYYYNGENLSDLENNPLSTPITPDDVSLIKLHLITNVNPDQNTKNTEIETLVRPRNIKY